MTIELLLLFPLLCAILLLIFQIALLMQARFVVNYAAFRAVRSAITVVPAAIRSASTGRREDVNIIGSPQDQSPKHEIVRRAAAIACIGISPPWQAVAGSLVPTTATHGIEQLANLALLFPAADASLEIGGQLKSRAPYALHPDNTQVEVQVEHRKNASGGASPMLLITTRVTYRYYLAVPFANRLFGQPYSGSGGQRGGYYTAIHAQYTLPIEADPIFPPDQRPPRVWEMVL